MHIFIIYKSDLFGYKSSIYTQVYTVPNVTTNHFRHKIVIAIHLKHVYFSEYIILTHLSIQIQLQYYQICGTIFVKNN